MQLHLNFFPLLQEHIEGFILSLGHLSHLLVEEHNVAFQARIVDKGHFVCGTAFIRSSPEITLYAPMMFLVDLIRAFAHCPAHPMTSAMT